MVDTHVMRRLQVAVVGSGPAGLYSAEALIKQSAVLDPPCAIQVDVVDRLPTPYGLVRYGVAPDHKSIKSIAEKLRTVLEHDSVSFYGGVHLGNDVSRDDLLASYDAVVYATGAMRDRRMAIPGEDLPGSVAATDFVNWYSGHPDVDPGKYVLDAESVAVIGVGNVAVDVARILIRNPEDLRETDVSQPVLDALMASKVREVHLIGRRGPAQAKFTTKELRELGELDGVEVVTYGGEVDLDAFDPDRGERAAGRGRPARPRQLHSDQGMVRPAVAGQRTPAVRPVLAAADRDPRPAAGVRADAGAHPPGLARQVHRHRLLRHAQRGHGAAQRRLPERAAGRCAVRRALVRRAERRGPGARPGRHPAARRVRGGLAQARAERRDRDQQVRRRADRVVAARRSGRRPRSRG